MFDYSLERGGVARQDWWRDADRPWWVRLCQRAGAAYTGWRRNRDIDGIVKALDNLSDRQLALLGIDRLFLRDRVIDAVERQAAYRAAPTDDRGLSGPSRDAVYDAVLDVDFTVLDGGQRPSRPRRGPLLTY